MNPATFQKASFYSNVPNMVLSFLLPIYCLELGFSPFETTGLFAVVSFMLLITYFIVGRLCDKMGRKTVFCIGLAIKVLSFCLLAVAQSAAFLYAAQAVKGMAIAFISVALFAMISDERDRNFARLQSTITAAGGKGELTGILIYWGLISVFSFLNAWKYFLLSCAVLASYALYVSKRHLTEIRPNSAPPKAPPLPRAEKAVLHQYPLCGCFKLDLLDHYDFHVSSVWQPV